MLKQIDTSPEIYVLPLPPTMNEIINEARGCRYKSAKTKDFWTDDIAKRVWGRKTFSGKVWMSWVWNIKNLRRDDDNLASARKYICDGLVAAEIIKNDSCRIIQTPVIHWHLTSPEDFVEVAISDRPDFLFDWMDRNRKMIMSQHP